MDILVQMLHETLLVFVVLRQYLYPDKKYLPAMLA